jgi:hypothetical protein
LWQPPRPHGQQPPERIVGPLELFYDLVVVVLIGQATRHLSGHLAWRGFGEYAAVFGLVWIAWVTGASTTSCTAATTPPLGGVKLCPVEKATSGQGTGKPACPAHGASCSLALCRTNAR